MAAALQKFIDLQKMPFNNDVSILETMLTFGDHREESYRLQMLAAYKI